MLKAIAWYTGREIWPRLGSILFSGGLIGAVCAGILLGRWGAYVVPSTTTVGALAIALLTYAAVALGFSLAGLTLTLTLPNQGFVELLCKTQPEKKKHDSYSDLLFIFSWTAMAHWLIVVASVGLVLFVNPQQPAFEAGQHRIKSGIIAGLSIYGFLQFLVTLITLSQVGSTYITHLRKLQTKQ